MLSAVSLTLIILAVFLGVPAAVLLVEVIAALKSVKAKPAIPIEANSRLAVIVPAHNESYGIVPTLEDIKPQLKPGDRLIVVADNCTDDTAAVAASAGA